MINYPLYLLNDARKRITLSALTIKRTTYLGALRNLLFKKAEPRQLSPSISMTSLRVQVVEFYVFRHSCASERERAKKQRVPSL